MKTCRALSSLLLLCVCLLGATACHREDTAPLQSIEDLRGKKVAVCVGSIHDEYLTRHYPDIDLLYMTAVEDMVLPIRNGQAVAGMLPLLAAKKALRTYPELALLGVGYMHSEVAFPFARQELCNRFNRYMAGLREDGRLAQMAEKWITDMEEAPMPEFRLSGENGSLRIGICPSVPFVFFRNGQPCGMEMELLLGFCEKEKLMPKFLTYNFSAILAALAMGQIEVISATVAITPERKEKILFSDPYYQLPAALITHQKYLAQPDSLGTMPREHRPFLSRLGAHVRLNLLAEKRYLLLLSGLKTTLILSLYSLLVGTLAGMVLCRLRMGRFRPVRALVRGFTACMNRLPPVVILLLMYYNVFSSGKLDAVTVASLSFGLYFSAMAAEIFRTCLLGVDPGQGEAGLALGLSKRQVFRHITLPQILRSVLPLYQGEMISLVKTTAVVGFIAVEDLTTAADIIRSHTFEAFFPLLLTAFLYFLLIYLLTALLHLLFPKASHIAT